MTPEAVADYLLGEQIALDAVALADLTQQAGAELPEDYKSFLTLRNGGFTSPTAREQPPLVTRDGHAIEQFYCATSLEPDWNESSIHNYRVMTLRSWLEETGGDPVNVPASWIVIGGSWDGDQFALDLSVPGGEVVWLDHELLPNEDDNSFPADDGVQRLGLTFRQFIEALETPAPTPRSSGLLERFWRLIGR